MTTITVMARNAGRGYFPSCNEINDSFAAVLDRVSPFHLHIRDGRLEPCVPCWMTFEEYDRHVIRMEPLS